jgi:hypothetical protein
MEVDSPCRRKTPALHRRRIVVQARLIRLVALQTRLEVDFWVFELRSHLHNRDLLVVGH